MIGPPTNRESRSGRAWGAWQRTAALLCALFAVLPRLAWAEPSPAAPSEPSTAGPRTPATEHGDPSRPPAPPTPTPLVPTGAPDDHTPEWLRGGEPEITAIEWAAPRKPENRSLTKRFLSAATLPLRVLLLVGLGLLLWRWRAIGQLARRVGRHEWRFLAFWSLVGAALRLIGGVRVPGFTSNSGYAHGFAVLREVLVRDHLNRDAHGNGLHAHVGRSMQ